MNKNPYQAMPRKGELAKNLNLPIEAMLAHISHINPAELVVISNRTTRCSRITERGVYHEC